MTYTIWPRELARVSQQTAVERDQLQETLRRLDGVLAQAGDGVAASAPVSAELGHFVAGHATVAAEILARIESALVNGSLAVAAYVRGDAEMAAQYGRASVVFTGPRPVLAPADPAAAPPPETVSGG
jgi:Family of unknown function (DUF6507)